MWVMCEKCFFLYNPILPISNLFHYLSACVRQFISPESPGNDHRNTPCAWMHTLGQSSHWGHFHPGKKGCHGCCHVASAEPDRAGHAADKGHYNMPPSPLHYELLGKRCCGDWQWCSAPYGWCGEDSNGLPRQKTDNAGILLSLVVKYNIYIWKMWHHVLKPVYLPKTQGQ